ncbi:MAG: hypothetical protein PHV17_08470 [Candidatus Omnitrophica bacterium]|nr:hypothetical protein [Candidatus Omnitrophota bacterium]
MRKTYLSQLVKSFLIILSLFSLAFFYLHQKVLCFVQAYELTEDQRCLFELKDRKDYLIYNISKETSLAKINEWSDNNQFVLADRDKIVALNLNGPKGKDLSSENRLVSLFNRFVSKVPDAVAQNRQ